MSLESLLAFKNKRLNSDLAAIAQSVPEMYRMYNVNPDEAISSLVQSHITLPTYLPGFPQTISITASGTVTVSGNASVVVTAKNMTGSPKTVSVALLLNDDATAIATKIAAALTADTNVGAFFIVTSAAAVITLTAKTNAEYDYTMAVSIATGTATGCGAVTANTAVQNGSLYETVHDDTLYFPHKWNGYHYWKAYTCFDLGLSQYENPCIAVANKISDTWAAPTGLTNPIIPFPGGTMYNSDPVLTMSPDQKTMYMIFRTSQENNTVIFYIISSTDGVQWSTQKALFTAAASAGRLCPAVWWDGSLWNMITIGSSDNAIYKRTATQIDGTWSAETACTYTLPNTIKPFHICVRKAGNQLHALCHTTDSTSVFFFGVSNDNGATWVFGKTPVIKRGAISTINYQLYKGSMIQMYTDTGLQYGVFYGTKAPYYFCYTELTFDRTRLQKDWTNGVLQAKIPLAPYVLGDTFNRADGAVGNADSGQAWVSYSGNAFNVVSGKCKLSTAGLSRLGIDIGVTDFFVECDIESVVSSAHLMFRYIDASNHWIFGPSGSGTYIQIMKLVGNVGTEIAKIATYSSGEKVHLGVMCYGNVLSFYINGKLFHQITDASNNTGTKVGMRTSETTATYDNITARSLY